jgi:hypothetical protein
MSSIPRPEILVLAASLGAYAACGSGSSGATTAAGACADVCNKQEACGDIDSVAANQCTTKCSADAQQINALATNCLNEGDILAATEQCLSRACTDYAACLTTLPACLTSGGTGGGGTGGGTGTGGTGTGGSTTGTTGTTTLPTGLSCTETMSGITLCEVITNPSVTTCPTGATQVSSCPTADVLGYCTLGDGGLGRVYFYSTGGFTASSAQSFCSGEGGTWTPG